MLDLKHILVIVDPTTEEQPAIERGAWLAKHAGGSLELFICDYDQYLAGGLFEGKALDKARKSLIENHTKRLAKLAEKISGGGVAVTVDAVWDKPLHEGIVRKVLRSKPGLVVKDTHYHSAINRALFSNTDWELIRDCPAPLLLVKPHEIGPDVSLIAAVDPMHERDKPAELDRRIIEIGGSLTAALGGRLDVLHAFDPSPAYAVSTDSMAFPISAPMTEMMQALRLSHEQAMAKLLDDYTLQDDQVHLLEGNIGELLLALIENLATDIVVMGAVARGPLERLVLGSTAERLLDRIPCDLLIVKPTDFATSVTPG
jgi:universal stress protein E